MIIFQCDTNDNNEDIYNIFEAFVNEYLDEEVKPALMERTGEKLLVNLVKVWEAYVIYSKMMDRSFEYLNRYYLKNNSLQLIAEKCMELFNNQVFNRKKEAITSAILEQIKKDRAGDAVDKEVIKRSIQVFVDIGLVKPKAMRTN